MTGVEIAHDHRCEAVVPGLQGRSMMGCRCAQRRAVRKVTLEVGHASSLTDESLILVDANPDMLVEDLVRRSMTKVLDAVRREQREPILSTLHLISEHDPWLDGTTFRWVVLTIPRDTPMIEAVLEIADDWMRARGLRS